MPDISGYIRERVNVERYVGWGCILNCFRLSSLPCFYPFCWSAIPTSCYTFNGFYSCVIFVCYPFYISSIVSTWTSFLQLIWVRLQLGEMDKYFCTVFQLIHASLCCADSSGVHFIGICTWFRTCINENKIKAIQLWPSTVMYLAHMLPFQHLLITKCIATLLIGDWCSLFSEAALPPFC